MPPRLLLATPAQDIALVDLTETPALRVVREAGVRDGYAWPTWSPDGAHVLASQGWRADDGDPRLGLVSLDLRDADAAAEAERPFSNPEGHREPIAPGVMHYAYWGPDGRRAIVVARGEDGLTLTLLTRAPAGPRTRAAPGPRAS